MLKNVLSSSRFWAALLAIVFVLLIAYVPAIASKLNEADVVTGVIALAAFIVAESAAGAGVGWAIFGKPRFWAVVVSFVFIFVRAFVPGFVLSEQLLQDLIAAIGAASIGVSYRPIGTTR